VKITAKFAVLPAVSLPLFYLLWIIFTGTFALHELLTGIVATLLATTGIAIISIQQPTRFSPRLADLLSAWRLPWYLVSGTLEIIVVAAKDVMGTKRAQSLFRIVPFDAGKNEGPRAAARRVLAVVYTTATPTSIVLGVNASNNKLLFHEINRTSISKMTKQLGAQT
jgi:multisubunit Na+/H+ antiporter MnhE subunit